MALAKYCDFTIIFYIGDFEMINVLAIVDRGAALSIAMGMFALTTSLLLYVKIRGIHKKTWKGKWSKCSYVLPID